MRVLSRNLCSFWILNFLVDWIVSWLWERWIYAHYQKLLRGKTIIRQMIIFPSNRKCSCWAWHQRKICNKARTSTFETWKSAPQFVQFPWTKCLPISVYSFKSKIAKNFVAFGSFIALPLLSLSLLDLGSLQVQRLVWITFLGNGEGFDH